MKKIAERMSPRPPLRKMRKAMHEERARIMSTKKAAAAMLDRPRPSWRGERSCSGL